MTVRIGTVWDSTQQVLAGRAGIMVPFAAIGFVLPGLAARAGAAGARPAAGRGGGVRGDGRVGAARHLGAAGDHGAGDSSGDHQREASRAGFRRMWPVLGVALAIGFVFALVALVMIVALGLSHYNFAAALAANGDPSKMPSMSGAWPCSCCYTV